MYLNVWQPRLAYGGGGARVTVLVEVARFLVLRLLTGQPRRQQRAVADAELAPRIRTIHDQDRALGTPRITDELNDGAAPDRRGQSHAGRPGDARTSHRGAAAAAPGPHHDLREALVDCALRYACNWRRTRARMAPLMAQDSLCRRHVRHSRQRHVLRIRRQTA